LNGFGRRALDRSGPLLFGNQIFGRTSIEIGERKTTSPDAIGECLDPD